MSFNSSELLHLIIQDLPHFIFWKDKQFVFQGCNLNFARLAGHAHIKDIIGKNDHDMCWKQYAEKYQEDDSFVLKGKSLKTIEHNLNSVQQINIVYVHKMPLYDASKQEIIGVLGYGEILNTYPADQNQSTLKDIVNSFIDPIVLDEEMIAKYFFGITKSESESLYLLIRGYTAANAATLLSKSHRTVENHIDSIKQKTETNSKQEALLYAFKMGYMNILPQSLFKKMYSQE